jgi:hypothetical protein
MELLDGFGVVAAFTGRRAAGKLGRQDSKLLLFLGVVPFRGPNICNKE